MIVLDEINISEAETFDFDITNNKILESKSNKKIDHSYPAASKFKPSKAKRFSIRKGLPSDLTSLNIYSNLVRCSKLIFTRSFVYSIQSLPNRPHFICNHSSHELI